MNYFKVAAVSASVSFVAASLIFILFVNLTDNHSEVTQSQTVGYTSPAYNVARVSNTSKANLEINTDRHNILTRTVSTVSNAVVGINVTEIRQYRDPFSRYFQDDPFYQYFFREKSYKVKGLGSGVIISPDGYIITNDHVAGNGVKIIVSLTSGKEYDAEIVGSDPRSDLCLLKINAENLPYVKFGNSDDIITGEWVIALGNPFGLFSVNNKPSVTIGVISSTGMNLDAVNNRYYIDMLQTDAAINGGNSGGPLVNALGELIGINTLIYTATGSAGNVGIGFAIPSNKVKRLVEELKTNKKIDRDFIVGFSVQTIDEEIANYFNLSSARGVIVTHVTNSSPASEAGIEVGDIIYQVDKFRINNESTMVGVLQEFRANQTITIKVLRNGNILSKNMRLRKK